MVSAETVVVGLQNALKACAAITDREQRLSCYDALATQPVVAANNTVPATRLAPLTPSPTTQAVSPESDEPNDFGLPAQSTAARVTSITARVIGFARDGNTGSIVVKLDNGQSWALAEADPLLASGDSVTIRRAALGSFMLKTPTGRTHKAHRTL